VVLTCDLLAFMKHAGIRNTLWLTADLHYTAAHYYDPNRAVYQDFEPFWEFVSGPLHAGTWTEAALEPTFGPHVAFHKAAKRRTRRQPCTVLWTAIFWPHGDRRRRERRAHCDAQRCRGSRAMVDHARSSVDRLGRNAIGHAAERKFLSQAG